MSTLTILQRGEPVLSAIAKPIPDVQVLGWEGCLSVKGKRALVSRHQSIYVQYLDEQGQAHQQTFTDFLARIFQHELDHLDGITFIERLDHEADAIDEQTWRATMASN